MAFLVVDLGSSSVRVLLFDDGARVIDGAVCRRKFDFVTDGEGRAEADPESLGALVEGCLDEILGHPRAGSIRAVGMTSFACNWLGMDSDGRARTPLMTYADTRGRLVLPVLREKLAGVIDDYHQETGCFLHPAYLPAQYGTMQITRPEALRKVKRISDMGGWLYRRWFGREAPISFSMASWTGLLDTDGLRWHEGYARLLAGDDILERLPPLADFDAAQSGLDDRYARRWPVLRDVPFFLAVSDGAAANVGSGAIDGGQMALSVGTTAALRVVKRGGRLHEGLWRYLICAGMPLIGGATSEGGNVYQWAVEQLGVDAGGLEAGIKQREPDGHGLTVLPLIAGERSPGWQAKATGTIHGIRRGTDKLDILQAHLEGVAMRLSLLYGLFDARDSVVMAGGRALLSSSVWAQMMADAFDAPLRLLAEAEISARGMALLLRHRLDGRPLNADPPRISRVVHPILKNVHIYQGARERQVALYRRLYG